MTAAATVVATPLSNLADLSLNPVNYWMVKTENQIFHAMILKIIR
jgi:hypothetical protein